MQFDLVTKNDFKPIEEKLERLEQRFNELSPLTSGDILNDNDLTKILKISKRSLINWRREGKISYTQVGSLIFYSKDDVMNFMNRYKKYNNEL